MRAKDSQKAFRTNSSLKLKNHKKFLSINKISLNAVSAELSSKYYELYSDPSRFLQEDENIIIGISGKRCKVQSIKDSSGHGNVCLILNKSSIKGDINSKQKSYRMN
jgi:hypothetical protein